MKQGAQTGASNLAGWGRKGRLPPKKTFELRSKGYSRIVRSRRLAWIDSEARQVVQPLPGKEEKYRKKFRDAKEWESAKRREAGIQAGERGHFDHSVGSGLGQEGPASRGTTAAVREQVAGQAVRGVRVRTKRNRWTFRDAYGFKLNLTDSGTGARMRGRGSETGSQDFSCGEVDGGSH